ncbi:hypothetical protein VNI00_004304 [Paramarasmius palmivorus]|uniref:Uncharacterized protein n=1 Tax=Paramarasmius palmivorus TaxID=297713 RepID=A0AAW0DNZ4_9AGAR
MAYQPSHRPAQSVSSNNLVPPTATPDQKRERRMTSPNLGNSGGRPPSPLRNGFVPSSSTGIDPNSFDDDDDEEEDDDDTDERAGIQRSPSPASSVSQMAASFAQRMGDLVNGMATPRSPSLPSDAELEAEAERERDRTRREAERIISREAAERKMVEDRVLAMMENTRALPPPPSRSQTMPNPNPPSPAGSQKESWWATAKNKLTPTKEKELTPAQQVIQDAKTRDKEIKRLSKGKEKEWSSNPNLQGSYADSALNLNLPPTTPTPQAPRRPAPGSPASPTPSRSNMAPNLSPSPLRSKDAGSSSPSREAPPLYAQFNAQGTLDVHVTLLTIAKRFEKLEKWTVGHVRALEERMSDVERWLVDKEKEKEAASVISSTQQPASISDAANTEIKELREEIVELQGRITEIGREMARLAVSPGNLSSAKSMQSTTPPTSSMHEKLSSSTADIIDPDMPLAFTATPHARTRVPSVTARHSTSPPMAASRVSAGTRLPYPTGDYAAPEGAFFSPPGSPPSSATKSRVVSVSNIPGLPESAMNGNRNSNTTATASTNGNTPLPSSSSSYSVQSFSTSSSISPAPSANRNSPTPSPAPLSAKGSKQLPVPAHKSSAASLRQNSTSPTPRKRYTVALGGPIVAPDDYEEQQQPARAQSRNGSRVNYTSSPGPLENEEDDDDDFGDETIGKSKGSGVLKASASAPDANNTVSTTKSLPSSPSNLRTRAQSAYGLSSIAAQSPNTMAALANTNTTQPLRPRVRSKSTDRLDSAAKSFVDPLVLRRQEAATKVAMPKPVGKVPVGQLVAFFDGERK